MLLITTIETVDLALGLSNVNPKKEQKVQSIFNTFSNGCNSTRKYWLANDAEARKTQVIIETSLNKNIKRQKPDVCFL